MFPALDRVKLCYGLVPENKKGLANQSKTLLREHYMKMKKLLSVLNT